MVETLLNKNNQRKDLILFNISSVHLFWLVWFSLCLWPVLYDNKFSANYLIFFTPLIYLFVNSEVAVTRIFGEFSEATTDGHTTNTYGTIMQAILLVFLYFIVVQIGNYIWNENDITDKETDVEITVPSTKNKQSNFKEFVSLLF